MNLVQELENQIQTNPKLSEAINYLINIAFGTNLNFIPIIEEPEYHQILLEYKIVNIQSNNRYAINKSHLLNHLVFNHLKEELGFKELKTVEEAEKFKETFDKYYEEQKGIKPTIIAIIREFEYYYFLWINLRFGYDFSPILEISGEDSEKMFENRMRFFYPFIKALQFLNLSAIRIVELVNHIYVEDRGDLSLLKEFKAFCGKNPIKAVEIFDLTCREEKFAREITAYALLGISSFDYSKAFSTILSFLEDDSFKQVALVALSEYKYKSNQDIQHILNIATQSNFQHDRKSINIFSQIVNSEFSTETQQRLVFSFLEKLCLLNDEQISESIIWNISKIERCEEMKFQFLQNNFLSPNNSIQWHINNIIRTSKNKKLAIEYIKMFILTNPAEDAIKRFENAVAYFSLEDYSWWLTTWFNEDQFILNSKCRDLVSILFRTRRTNLELDNLILNNLSYNDIEFITCKILGWVIQHEPLTSLIFSLLKRNVKDENVEQLVKYTFYAHILYNYRSPIRFLKDKSKNGTKIEKQIAKDILKEDELYQKIRKELPFLQELQIPYNRIKNYNKEIAKKYKIQDKFMEDNILATIATNVIIRAGKGFFSRLSNGSYSPPAILQTFQVDIELPSGEITDPIGQQLQRIYWQSFEREK